MKSAILASISIISVMTFSTIARAGQLDGVKFCRSVHTGGFFGQPVGTREHCVSFDNDSMTDNANTFFGNPPETYAYTVDGDKIVNATINQPTEYVIDGNNLVIAKTHAVLTRQ